MQTPTPFKSSKFDFSKSILQQDSIDNKVKELATQVKQKPATKLTRNDLFGDAKKIVEAKGIDRQAAMTETLKYYKAKGLQVDGLDIDAELESMQPQEPIEKEVSTIENVKAGGENLVGGAIANIPNIIGNTFGFLADVVTPKEMEGLGDFFRESGIRDKQGLQDVLGVDPDAFMTQAGEFGSEIATLMTPTGAAGGIAKLGEKAPVLVQGLKNIAKLTDKAPQVLKSLGASSLKGASEVGKLEVISEGEVTPTGLVVGAIANPVLQGVGTLAKGAINKFGGARTVDEVAGNILQPTGKYGSLNFESAKQGLNDAMNKLGKQEIKDVKDYKSLLGTIKSEQNSIFKPLTEGLSKIKGKFTDSSVTDAVTGLADILSKQPGKKFKALSNEVSTLAKKNIEGGLTVPEIQRLKILHTQNNRLFTDTGKEASGVSSEALREVRKDLKQLIESEASKQGFKDVAEINTKYANLLDAEGLINTQIGRLTNYLGREGKQAFLQNVAEFVTELPGVKQAVTQPVQTVFGKVFKTLRAGKINPIEVEKQLPSLIKELRAANVPDAAINEAVRNILSTMRIISSKEISDLINND